MKKVVLGVTGCIGAYKAPDLVRALRKRDLRVQVILTRAAREFVSPLALVTVSGEPVLEHLFPDAVPGETGGEGPDPTGGVRHISLTEETDVFLVAPATAHVIARMALGLADDFLTTFHLAVRAPILIAPAMNTNMLAHEATRGHLRTLRERGATVIEPGEGELACGWLGPGRLAEIPEIVEAVEHALEETATRQDLAGRKVVVAAGPTREPIDPVRYLTNRSSGRMGFELAEVAAGRGADVTLVLGPTDLDPPPGQEVVRVETAREMRDQMLAAAPEADAVVMAAAVADFRPAHNSGHKLKSTGFRRDNATSSLTLVANPDILAELGAARSPNSGSGPAVLIGFAAETGEPEGESIRKLEEKRCDLIVGNQVGQGRVFGLDSTQAVLVESRDGQAPSVSRREPESKRSLADAVCDVIVRRLGNGA
ncbi:MAG: bifunctional phosphopantothenoylcysteine decarboxylase/phosphopantothenate--cysteine ligase CoaBC [Acidobacteria bacterium]|nr:bifunctional phosphopantothenoylcysteine decarboxylase/phosphopantothenate--cysteine ligase CoaBC [Acidobacteriota bacterium]MYG74995.1 bifunctional phosphopantothenoylcysteine decarboxylase/phosphopantothenate--cysteine ligase CoaBC [Acidobacteriota bacterium]